VSYSIATQTPQYRADTLQDLMNMPVTGTNPSAPPSLMASLVSMQRGSGMSVVSHYNVAPVIDIFGSVDGRDLGAVSGDINKIVDSIRNQLPRGSRVVIRGIAWMLFVTHTTLSVPALMGAIMCMGVATANSILVVSFAREQMAEGKDPITAALQAGFTRFRPVLMTALAMVIGMVPMALGMGDGGEQNAPLGRAVIGGLLFATISTLLFVPTFFSLLHGRRVRNTTTE
jgi:multidrug efflux pump subunit AcrB